MKQKKIRLKKYIFLEHTADIKFRAFGKTIEDAFRNSAYAMFKAMYEGEVKKSKKIRIKARGKDFESLLYNFLEEFLIMLDSEGFFLSRIRNIKIDKKKNELTAEAIGDNSKNYEIGLHVKAVTYNDMFVRHEDGKWIAQVVLDV
jgi:SHS2 domain-containing protein